MQERKKLFESILRDGIKAVLNTRKINENAPPQTPVPGQQQQTPSPPQQQPNPGPPAPKAEPAQLQGTEGTVGGQGQPSLTVDVIIEKLNLIRRGRSFSDAVVYGNLSTFFNALSEQDKVTLDNLLSQIGQIVIAALSQQPTPQQMAAAGMAPPSPNTSPLSSAPGIPPSAPAAQQQ